MADINYSVTLKVDKDNLSNSVSANGITADMSAVGLLSQTLTLSTSAISISTANLSSVGLAFLRNLSTATASVAQVGVDSGGTFVSFASLRAGEPAATDWADALRAARLRAVQAGHRAAITGFGLRDGG